MKKFRVTPSVGSYEDVPAVGENMLKVGSVEDKPDLSVLDAWLKLVGLDLGRKDVIVDALRKKGLVLDKLLPHQQRAFELVKEQVDFLRRQSENVCRAFSVPWAQGEILRTRTRDGFSAKLVCDDARLMVLNAVLHEDSVKLRADLTAKDGKEKSVAKTDSAATQSKKAKQYGAGLVSLVGKAYMVGKNVNVHLTSLLQMLHKKRKQRDDFQLNYDDLPQELSLIHI